MDRRNLRVRKVSEKLAVVDEDERKRVSFSLSLFPYGLAGVVYEWSYFTVVDAH